MIKIKNDKSCSLCGGEVRFFFYNENRNKKYYSCTNCNSVMMDPLDYLSEKDEKKRYLTHNNDVEDAGYQKFVSPIVEAIKKDYDREDIGLDYGAGTGPVITSLLEKADYQVKLYDPYFHLYPEKLLESYNYIICSEVIEHFYNPYYEFKRLSEILKPNGSIFCMTGIYDEEIDFEKWSYKEDVTHVFFYHKKALEWIKKEFGFTELRIEERVIQFKVKS